MTINKSDFNKPLSQVNKSIEAKKEGIELQTKSLKMPLSIL